MRSNVQMNSKKSEVYDEAWLFGKCFWLTNFQHYISAAFRHEEFSRRSWFWFSLAKHNPLYQRGSYFSLPINGNVSIKILGIDQIYISILNERFLDLMKEKGDEVILVKIYPHPEEANLYVESTMDGGNLFDYGCLKCLDNKDDMIFSLEVSKFQFEIGNDSKSYIQKGKEESEIYDE